jgi:hypothetical protein
MSASVIRTFSRRRPTITRTSSAELLATASSSPSSPSLPSSSATFAVPLTPSSSSSSSQSSQETTSPSSSSHSQSSQSSFPSPISPSTKGRLQRRLSAPSSSSSSSFPYPDPPRSPDGDSEAEIRVTLSPAAVLSPMNLKLTDLSPPKRKKEGLRESPRKVHKPNFLQLTNGREANGGEDEEDSQEMADADQFDFQAAKEATKLRKTKAVAALKNLVQKQMLEEVKRRRNSFVSHGNDVEFDLDDNNILMLQERTVV